MEGEGKTKGSGREEGRREKPQILPGFTPFTEEHHYFIDVKGLIFYCMFSNFQQTTVRFLKIIYCISRTSLFYRR